jgi:Zn-dependent M28 family amino/carboxypeptidase
VGAVVPGNEAADELIIYMAHWDHMGTGPDQAGADNIYNGAEDNASGTGGILELAQAFSTQGLGLRRSVGFLAVTAEESGLLGSQAYVEAPAFALNQTVAGINLDRLNFRGPVADVSVIGYGSSELEILLADEAALVLRTLTPEATPEKGSFYRSDHFNFARKGVPVLYARGGTQHRELGPEHIARLEAEYISERYHAPSDEIQLDWDLVGAIDDLKLFFYVGLRLAQGQEWPNWYETSEFRAARDESMTSQSP